MSSLTLRSILLIDDDEISNLFNQIFIKRLDLDVEVNLAYNGKEALDYLSSGLVDNKSSFLKPCLLLLDIRMPIMDGWEFLKVYDQLLDQETKNQIVVVMLTTSEDEQDTIKAMDDPNIKGILKKPLSENKFNEMIHKFFTDKKAL